LWQEGMHMTPVWFGDLLNFGQGRLESG